MKLNKLLISLSALSAFVAYVLSNPLTFGLCQRPYIFNDYRGCLDDSISSIGEPLLAFSLISFALLLTLSYLKTSINYSWLRFAAWWLPLSAVLIATTPETSNSWMPLYFIGKSTVTMIMASLFTAISLILIVWKQFNLGKRLT